MEEDFAKNFTIELQRQYAQSRNIKDLWLHSATAAGVPVPDEDAGRIVVMRSHEVTESEARELGIFKHMLRQRLSATFWDIDRDWLNENLEGMFVYFGDRELIGFELESDMALFRLKFHGTK